MADSSDLTELQQEAFNLVKSEGELYQSDLWKQLDIGSRSGTRISRRLADAGLITREKTTHDGRTTYRLTHVEGATPTDSSEDTPTETGSISASDAPAHDADLSPTQERALAFIHEQGRVTQSDLWKQLDIASRTGTRAARALADAGLIDREETVENARKTYVLTPAETATENAETQSTPEPESEPDTTTEPDATDSDEPETPETEDLHLPGDVSLSDTERSAYEYIQKTNGIPENALQTHLDTDRETVHAVVDALYEENLIDVTETSYYGRKTYWVEPTTNASTTAPA